MELTPKSRNVTLGDWSVLSCFVDSQPLSSIIWMKDAMPINTTRYAVKNTAIAGMFTSRVTSNLTISAAGKRDHGVYECVANNQIGNKSRKSSIRMLCELNYRDNMYRDLVDNSTLCVEEVTLYKHCYYYYHHHHCLLQSPR